MKDSPHCLRLADARTMVRRWGAISCPHARLAAELLAVCVVRLSRRHPRGWSERDLLLETALPFFRFEDELLRSTPLKEGFFNASVMERMNILAMPQSM